jgi:RNA ligase
MPTSMWDLFSPDALHHALTGGYVKAQQHPSLPLRILNYTTKTQYEGAWNKVTRQCRGLIVDAGNDIVARPFPKFFNHAQPGAGPFDLDARVHATDKLDGSLGVLYPTGDARHAVATRSSFISPQARHATCVWRDRYEDHVDVSPCATWLFEIIYPGNRIVCDYGDSDDLFLLGAIDLDNGRFYRPELLSYDGPTVAALPYRTLRDALQAEPRPGAEGIVIRLVDHPETALKIKQADYVELHRVLTSTTDRVIWAYTAVNACAHLVDNPKHWNSFLDLDPARATAIVDAGPDWMVRLADTVPDEMHAWLKATVNRLYADATTLARQITDEAARLRAVHGTDRAALFAEARQHPHYGAVMMLLDGRDITTYVWRALYPPAGVAWLQHDEDAA